MTRPVNDDLANCELSAEQLEAIAAGWPHWFNDAIHAVQKDVSNFMIHHPLAAGIIGGVGTVAVGVGFAVLPLL